MAQLKPCFLGADDLHNVIASGAVMVLDIRPVEMYNKCTFLSAIHLPSALINDSAALLKRIQAERQHLLTWKRFLVLATEDDGPAWRNIQKTLSVDGNFHSPRYALFVLYELVEEALAALPFVTWSPGDGPMERGEQWGDFDRNTPPHRILPHLYLGSYLNVMNLGVLEALNCFYVVNATGGQFGNKHQDDDKFHYLSINVQDESAQDISIHFERVSAFVKEAQANSCNCVIHCAEGKSRSSSLVLAYLMQEYDMGLQQASMVAKRRSLVMPNGGFTMQLLKYESKLNEAKAKDSKALPETDKRGRAPFIDELYNLHPLPGELQAHPDRLDLQIDTHGMIWRTGLNKVIGWKREDGSVLFFDAAME